MNKKILAYDLGTGGLKASVFSASGELETFEFVNYPTSNLSSHMQEQSPMHWWDAIVEATGRLLRNTFIDPEQIETLAISGHSLGVVPLDKDGQLLMDSTPIWSDKRASAQAAEFFKSVDYEKWYMTTGNGFPAECYSIFKILWYRDNHPEMYSKIRHVVGTKDFCNYLFTGNIATDHSYGSGSGVYSLKERKYLDEYIAASGIDIAILPEILPSTAVVGTINEWAAQQTGLSRSTKVICGGVDNSCMALGAGGYTDGHVYTSLGSSAWVALSSREPVLSFSTKPYVFAHVVEGMYASATCIFSAGTSLRWVLDNLCDGWSESERFERMTTAAMSSPVGSGGLMFNPSLAGGSMLEKSPNILGGFAGLNLSHTKADMLRATLEGIALNLRVALDELRAGGCTIEQMLMVGGGAKNPFWMQLFAHIYGVECLKSSIDQECASLGAAALAAVGSGLWSDFSPIASQHHIEHSYLPEDKIQQQYNLLLEKFKKLSGYLADFGDL